MAIEGLASPNWGRTIRVHRRGSAYHGIYVGAGPYLAVTTALDVDGQPRDVLAGSLGNVPNATIRPARSLERVNSEYVSQVFHATRRTSCRKFASAVLSRSRALGPGPVPTMGSEAAGRTPRA